MSSTSRALTRAELLELIQLGCGRASNAIVVTLPAMDEPSSTVSFALLERLRQKAATLTRVQRLMRAARLVLDRRRREAAMTPPKPKL